MKYFEYFGQKLVIKQFHIDCEIGANAAIRLAFPDAIICYCNVHILRAITKHFKKYLGAHFYNTKIFLELFKVVTGAFYLDFENKELKDEFLKLLDSFVPRAGRFNSSFKADISKVLKYLKSNFFGHRARFPPKFWPYRYLAFADKFQFSTNGIESLNRSLKYFLGLEFVNMDKLDSEMNRFHSNKLVQSTDGLVKGRLHSKRRKTILRETDIFDILTKYEGLSQTSKIAHLQFHLLEIGT